MRIRWRQVATLLRVAMRMDLRSQGTLRTHGRRRLPYPFFLTLGFYLILSISMSAGLAAAGAPTYLFATAIFAAAGVLVIGNIILEYQEILLAPADGDVLFWRPIDSRTLFVGKLLHLLVYVFLLGLPLLVVPAMIAAGMAHRFSVFWAFGAAGVASNLMAAAVTILLYALLLRRVSAERFQDVLAYAQLAFMMVLFLGYQSLTPILQRLRLGEGQPERLFLLALPARWFAALPEAASTSWSATTIGLFAGGTMALGAVGWFAVGRLAPRYEDAIVQVQSASPGRAPRSVSARLQSVVARSMSRNPLRRAGFDFLLANLQGDRKIKVTLLSSVALPLAFLAYAFLSGETSDPYARPAAASASPTGPFHLYFAVYMMGMLAVSLIRVVPRSGSWRAGWLFYAAPLRRFDDFYSGVLWGLFYGILLPCASVIAMALLFAWRDPMHVAAHIAPPVGVCLLVFPISALFGVDPPFSCEPQRHARFSEFIVSLLITLPVWVVGVAHYLLRQRPGLLVGVGAAFTLVAVLVWRIASLRLRGALLSRPFDA